MSSNKGHEFSAYMALTAMLLWFCDEIIFFGQIPFFRDLVTYFYPIKYSVAQAFKAGSLPLWDRHMASGFPLMAGFQSAVFYPLSSVFYVLPFFAAVRFNFVFHYGLAATGAYVLFRSWKSPVYISVIGAIVFAFGGTMVSLENLLNHFQSAVWLPWVVFFWERAVQSRRWKDIVIFALVGLCQLLAGSPEIFLFSIGLVLIDTLRLDRQIHGSFRVLLVLLGAGLIITGLGMIQLLPTAELILQSRRDQLIPASEALAWSLQPSSLIGLLLPTLEADASLSVGVRLLLTDGVPLLLSHYIGLIGLLGLFCWFKNAPVKERIIVIALMTISLALAFGRYTPVYPFAYEWLSVLRVMRFPEKYFYVTFALLVFTTVRGLTEIAKKRDFRICSIFALSGFIVWLVIYGLFCWRLQLLETVLHLLRGGQNSDVLNPRSIASILVILEKQIAVSMVLSLLFSLYWLGLLRGSLFQPLIILAVFLDLSSANKPLHFVRDEHLIQTVSRVIGQPPAEHARVFYYPPGNNLHPSFMRVAGNPTYEKATEIALNNLLPNSGLLYGFEYFQDIDALGRRSYTDFLNFINALPIDQRGKLLRILNVKYVVAFHALEVKGLKLVRQFPEHYSQLYEVLDSAPRTYVVPRATYDENPFSTLRRLSSESFDPNQEVVVDAPLHIEPKPIFRGDATIAAYQNNKLQINAHLNAPGILVLTDAFYPGWKVFVDKQQQRILRANYLFRGVELAPGNHTVEFMYEPSSFKIGFAVSLLTAALLVIVPLVGWSWRWSGIRQCRGASAQIPTVTIADHLG